MICNVAASSAQSGAHGTRIIHRPNHQSRPTARESCSCPRAQRLSAEAVMRKGSAAVPNILAACLRLKLLATRSKKPALELGRQGRGSARLRAYISSYIIGNRVDFDEIHFEK